MGDADFIPFESTEQFTPLIAHMAARAAQEVLALREKFKSLADIYRYLVAHAAREGVPACHAAVAAALAGDSAAARMLFKRIERWPTEGLEWRTRVKSNSVALAKLLDDPVQFRLTVLAIIEGVRGRLRLPADPQCLEFMDSTAVE